MSLIIRGRRALNSQIFRFFSTKVGDEVPVALKKDEKNPVIKEDSEYPEWLFTLLDPKKEVKDFNNTTWNEARRQFQRERKAKIKANNASG
eukprot:maker-scaffold_29-snap-gene-1.3-mRNA-1 protein AED:0.38 eAED:0.38 QI:100/1/1/1/1/1/4/69/90